MRSTIKAISGPMFEAVFDIARSGEGYVAIERASLLVRKLKRLNQIRDAFHFLMQLANALLDAEQWAASGVAANRALSVFPDNPVALDPGEYRQTILEFIVRLTPACFSPDLSTFLDSASLRVGDPDFQICGAWADLADRADSFHHAQVAYLKLIFSKLPGSIDASDDLQRLAGVLWRWIASIPDTRIAIFTSQFITVRPIVALLGSPSGTRGPKDRAAQKLLDLVEQNAQVRGLPLVFFARLIVRAVKRGDGKAFAEVVKAFGPLLEKDAEMLRWIRRIESMYFKAGQPAGGDGGLANLGAMINEVIGSLSRPT